MRREILDMARSTGFEGSILDLYQMANQGANVPALLQAEAQAKQENMLVAQTPQEQQVGLREQQAMGNIGASMVFPDVPANTSFNTEGMRVPINITKVDDQGHLVQSYQNVPPGIKDLPTGPKRGTVIETPAYQDGGFKGIPLTTNEVLDLIPGLKRNEEQRRAQDQVEIITNAGFAGREADMVGRYFGSPMEVLTRKGEDIVRRNLPTYIEIGKNIKKSLPTNPDPLSREVNREFLKIRLKQQARALKESAKRIGKDVFKAVKPFVKSAGSFTTLAPVDISRDASDMPALYGTGAAGDPTSIDKYSSKIYKKGGIYIKPENRGKFTAWAKRRGMTVKEAASKVMANKEEYPTSVVKMANFAKNFAKKKGGYRSKHGKDPVTGTGKKPKGSGRRLYTDENPKDTVGIRFATPADARATVAKVKRVNKPFARKIQILTVGEQRAKVMGKRQVASIFTKGKEAIRRSRKRA